MRKKKNILGISDLNTALVFLTKPGISLKIFSNAAMKRGKINISHRYIFFEKLERKPGSQRSVNRAL